MSIVESPTAASGSHATESGSKTSQELLVEIGWIVPQGLPAARMQMVQAARQQALEAMQAEFPEFRWRMPLVERNMPLSGPREPTVSLLEFAAEQRDVNRWDFALLITPSDLITYYRPYALAGLSRSLAAAVISLARVAPETEKPRAQLSFSGANLNETSLPRQIRDLVLHLLGHWNGLSHSEDPENFMFDLQNRADLARTETWTAEQRSDMTESLREIADPRLEELSDTRLRWPIAFYVSSLWTNREKLFTAIWEARPWELPLRLSRLFSAALASLLLLLVTAEIWELGTHMPAWASVGLSCGSIVMTVGYLLFRQRLLVRRMRKRLSEQRVITNTATVAIVTLGVLATYALLFGITAIVAWIFMASGVVSKWAALSGAGRLTLTAQANLAAVVSSFGILIGSLGATFEGQNYFRHITFVDEET